MIAYFILMLIMAAIFAVLGILLYKGKTNLIHDYHQTRIAEEDKANYGKEFSVGIFVIAAGMLLSGIAAILNAFNKIAIVMLIAGIVIGVIIICKVQRKYNGGMF